MMLTKLGPFDIATLSREMVADVVINQQRAPMVARQVIDGMPHYAIISNRDNLKILCVGCFKEGTTLADDSWCRTCTSLLSIGRLRTAFETGSANQQKR